MKILHTALRYPPATGGAEVYVQNIVERTRDIKSNRDVRVLTSAMRTHGPINMLEPEQLLDDPIYVQRLHTSTTPYVSYPRLQALSYYIGHHKPDILESYGFWYQVADTSARYAKKHNIPFIFHPIYYENRVRRKPIWQLYKNTIGKATFKTADVVVVLSEFEKSLIQQSGLPVKRFEIIPPGIDIAAFQNEQENPFTKRSIPGTILLSVSRIARAKGLQSVIQALPDISRSIPDAQFVIIGEDFGYADKLRTLARKLGVEDRVHMLGKFSDNELIGAFQNANVFIHASHYEAFGIVLAEAMAAGCPVVARNTTAIPFVVPNEKAGLLFSVHSELIKSVIRICKDSSLAQSFGAFGKNHVEQNFTWDKSINKLLSIYDEFTSP
ncbi:MAG: glycosyltransferase family 4 protein [bacterium]|nr:glycosyltransferase family 4 protein [bacterium]